VIEEQTVVLNHLEEDLLHWLLSQVERRGPGRGTAAEGAKKKASSGESVGDLTEFSHPSW